MTDLTAVQQNREAPAFGISEASVGDYIALMKPRVMSLVVFTALVGLMVAPGHLHPVLGFAALLCIAVGAGAAGALNMWFDADVDAVMSVMGFHYGPGRPRCLCFRDPRPLRDPRTSQVLIAVTGAARVAPVC